MNNYSGKSLEKYPLIQPNKYDGLWSAYFVKILFENGKYSEDIEIDQGVRGINCHCEIEVDDDGFVYAK